MKRPQLITLALAAVLLLAPLAAHADSHQQAMPLTWLSYAKAQTGKGNQLGQYLAEQGKKIYDGLMADGQVITWGVAQPINHRPGDDFTHIEWVTFRDWAAVDTFIQGFMAMQMAKSPEQQMKEQEKWYSLIEPGSHYDEIFRHQVLRRGDGSRPGYYRLGFHRAKPGQAAKLKALYEANGLPVLEKLQADGKIGAFGLATLTVHGGGSGSHLYWIAMPNLAANDALSAAFAAAVKERGEEAQKALMGKWQETLDFSAHHDRIIAVTHWGVGSGGGDTGGTADE